MVMAPSHLNDLTVSLLLRSLGVEGLLAEIDDPWPHGLQLGVQHEPLVAFPDLFPQPRPGHDALGVDALRARHLKQLHSRLAAMLEQAQPSVAVRAPEVCAFAALHRFDDASLAELASPQVGIVHIIYLGRAQLDARPLIAFASSQPCLLMDAPKRCNLGWDSISPPLLRKRGTHAYANR